MRAKVPDTFFRVTTKGIIRNDVGEVLLVKEKNGVWTLPGGGMSHGETDKEALTRELQEEALISQSFEAQIVGVDTRFLELHQAYLIWIVYELTFAEPLQYGAGPDALEAKFVNPKTLKDSRFFIERWVYKWCVDRTYEGATDEGVMER